MFNLIPWKKRSQGGAISVRQSEPSRQDLGYYPLIRFREELESLMSRFFEDPWLDTRSRLPSLWNPPQFDWNVDFGWEDKEKEYVFRAELPGFEPEDFDVKVSGNMLTIRAEHSEETKDKQGGFSYQHGAFSRTFTLPHGLDEEHIDARYHSGVLELHLPKTELAQGKRIPVNDN